MPSKDAPLPFQLSELVPVSTNRLKPYNMVIPINLHLAARGAILPTRWQNSPRMAEAKATKRELLEFIKDREIITAFDLIERFGYSYSYAYKRLSLLRIPVKSAACPAKSATL